MTIAELIASVVITIVPIGGQLSDSEFYCWWEVWGIYDWSVFVCELNDWNTEHYKNHEIGHVIYDKFLTKKQKKIYAKQYKKDYKRGVKAFYDEYSMTDVEEWFCEDYASLMTKKRVNIYVKKRQKIILSFFN